MSIEQIEQQMNTQMTNKFTIKYDGMDEVMTKEELNNLISAMKTSFVNEIARIKNRNKELQKDSKKKNNERKKEVIGGGFKDLDIAKKEAKEAEKLAKKEAKEAEKLSKKEAKETDKLAKKEAKETEKLAKKEAKEAEKLAKKEAKKAEKEEAKKNRASTKKNKLNHFVEDSDDEKIDRVVGEGFKDIEIAKKEKKEYDKMAKKEAKEAEKFAKKEAKEAEKIAKKEAKEAEKLAKKEGKKVKFEDERKDEEELKEGSKHQIVVEENSSNLIQELVNDFQLENKRNPTLEELNNIVENIKT